MDWSETAVCIRSLYCIKKNISKNQQDPSSSFRDLVMISMILGFLGGHLGFFHVTATRGKFELGTISEIN